MDTNNSATRNAISEDLGVSRDVSAGGAVERQVARMDVAKLAQDLHAYTDEALNRSVPETVVARIVDAVLPSKTRAAHRRAETEMVVARLDSRVAIARSIYSGQEAQVTAMIDTTVKAVRLQAAEDVAVRGLDAAGRVDDEIARSGAAFDRKLDADVETAALLKSNIAKHASATRLEHRISMRTKLEEEVMGNVARAIKGSGRKQP